MALDLDPIGKLVERRKQHQEEIDKINEDFKAIREAIDTPVKRRVRRKKADASGNGSDLDALTAPVPSDQTAADPAPDPS